MALHDITGEHRRALEGEHDERVEQLRLPVDHINERKSAIVHCWESTKLLQAWDKRVQVTAISRSKEIFPSIKPHQK